MQRRKFVIGTGALASGAAAAIGTGAFSFVRADRDITVNVVDDADAYLGLEALSAYAEDDDGQLGLSFEDNGYGEGLNDNADSAFDDVFTITNQGTNEVVIYINNPDSEGDPWDGVNEDPVGFYADGDYDAPLTADPDHAGTLPILAPGESIDVSVIFWLVEGDKDDIPDQVSITAEEN